ncbi:MAG TPA: ABC transporter, partial [Ruminiclostridium sp.]|nr:ABC transporter [Ruminiclostridium sp.]
MIIGGTMGTGELMSFISYISQILISLMMISFAFVGIVISRASVSRIVEVLDEEIDIKDHGKDADLAVDDGSIIYDHVSFSYCGN